MTSPSKPGIGDLVNWRGEIGIVQESRGIDIKVHWMKSFRYDSRLIGFSWLRRTNVKVLSKA